ncbi:MAG: peptidase [Bryobacterales bacterium]|nr:peptidase [Bryobacterales bacterium]
MNLEHIQEELTKQRLDGWLFFDHHHRDALAYNVLGLSPTLHVSRRWYYLIPAHGTPRGLVHRIEPGVLDSLPGEKGAYSSWREQVDGLQVLLRGMRRVAMQYSPFCEIPYVSMVDAGTVELVKRTGVEVVSSAELVQYFEARLDAEGLESHLEAGRRVDRVREDAFRMIAAALRENRSIDEYSVQQFILRRFAQEGMVTDNPPIVGVNRNAGNPHYAPAACGSSPVAKGDFVLIDMWAKLNTPHSVYYDITWTGYCGEVAPDPFQKVFEVVRDARDAAIHRVQSAFDAKQLVRGFEVDDAARRHIEAKGFGRNFIHRTGHSIGHEVHGNGANMDNLEVHDERKLISWTCFSIEPGIYLDDFGVRSEVNMFLDDNKARVTGEVQRNLLRVV